MIKDLKYHSQHDEDDKLHEHEIERNKQAPYIKCKQNEKLFNFKYNQQQQRRNILGNNQEQYIN